MDNEQSGRLERVKQKKIFVYMLIITFCFFPLLSTTVLRFDAGSFQVPLFIIVLAITVSIAYAEICTRHYRPEFRLDKLQKAFLIALLVFLVFHLVNTVRASDFQTALTLDIKLGFSLLSFILIAFFFSDDIDFIGIIIDTIIITSCIFLVIYLIKYLFVFHSPYLSIDWNMATRAGRNQMGIYLAIVTPLALWRYIFRNTISIWLLPAFIHSFATFYTLSRGAWISTLLSFLIFVLLAFIKTRQKNSEFINAILKRVALVIVIVLLLSIPTMLSQTRAEAGERFLSIRIMEDIEGSSIQTRSSLISEGIDAFLENPILGIGTSNLFARTGKGSHNDYIAVIGEQGLVGFALFLIMLFMILIKISRLNYNRWEHVALGNSSIAIIIYMLFINIYTNIGVFIIFSLLLCLREDNHIDVIKG